MNCRAAAGRCGSTRTNMPPSTASCCSGRAPKPIIRRRCRPRAGLVRRGVGKRKSTLLSSIMAGLPGAFDRYDIPALRRMLDALQGCRPPTRCAERLARFLREVIPTAEEVGIRMAIHPDDPPRPLMGLPRIVSTADDLAFITDAVDSPANGITLCTGSLGAGAHNDVPAIARRFAEPHPFRASAQCRQGAGRLVHGGRPPGRRHRHGRGGEALLAEQARRRDAGEPAGACRSARITATSCWTISARRAFPAIRRSAG